MNDLWLNTLQVCFMPSFGGSLLAQENPVTVTTDLVGQSIRDFTSFLPSLLGSIAIFIIGWLVATVVASVVKGILHHTEIDNKIAAWVTGQSTSEIQIEKWIATVIYWLIFLSAVTLAANNMGVSGIGGPLGSIFAALPQVIGAFVLAGLAWIVACVARTLVIKGLGGFRLDDRLASSTGSQGGSPFLVNETIGDIIYWLIFLFFLPLILAALPIPSTALTPVTGMVDDLLAFIPNILAAVVIGFVGWFIARVVKGIVTNLLNSIGADSLADRMGLPAAAGEFQISTIVGTLVYVLILVPFIISALNALKIEAISGPAIGMLEETMDFLPRLFAAAVIMVVFYVIGRFISGIVSTFLAGLGFDNLFEWLGLSGLQSMVPTQSISDSDTPEPYVRGTSENQAVGQVQTPSALAGTAVLIGTMLVGAGAATEALQLAPLTQIVENVLGISMQVLSGVLVFAIGLFFANLAFKLIASAGTAQSNTLAQAARVSILIFVGAMALRQMGVATDIVNLAFGLLLGAIAVAIAIAFGLGGRDVANEEIRGFLNSFKGR